MAFLSSLIATVASFVAGLGSSACVIFLVDEPECPKNLIK